MMEAYRGRGLVRIWLAPINLERCSDRLLGLTGEWARRYGIGIHLHLSETPYQKQYATRRFGMTAVRHLNELGFLGPHLTVGHAVWVTESDLDLLAANGTCICHNASSNLRLRSGIAPVRRFLERGIPVALGIDEAGLNDDRDMLQEMRLVKHLHCEPGLGIDKLKAAQIFRMATEAGAKAIGFGDEIGAIEPGKRADLVLLDFERISTPFLDPRMPIAEAIIYRARSAHVDTVMIDGEIVLAGGRAVRVDQQSVHAEIARSLAAAPSPQDEARWRLTRAIFPYLRRFYDDWPLPETQPYNGLNSRN
jgi:cytosine/adenosine deaminase-related metal-dependent hydrolase